MPCCLLLNGVLALHVQLVSHLITMIGEEVVIKGLLITCDGTTNAGGMCREDSTDLGQHIINIQGTQSAHPFVSMIDDTFLFVQ